MKKAIRTYSIKTYIIVVWPGEIYVLILYVLILYGWNLAINSSSGSIFPSHTVLCEDL